MQKIEAGIGEKFSVVIQFVTTFFAAFVVSFTQEWRLTLVMLAYTPLIVVATMLLGKVCMHYIYFTCERFICIVCTREVKIMPSSTIICVLEDCQTFQQALLYLPQVGQQYLAQK